MNTTSEPAKPGITHATKFTPERKAKWLQVYAEVGTVSGASKAVGINRDTAYAHRASDDEFREAWDKQEVAVTDLLEKTLIQIAIEGEGNVQVRALEFALRARRPLVYRESVNVNHGGKVKHEVEVDEAVNSEVEKQLGENERLRDRLAKLSANGAAAPAGGSPS